MVMLSLALRGLGFTLLALLGILSICTASFADREKEVLGHASREGKGVNVAFLFAGTPRSFVVGMVHESIRNNLIHTLCPPPLCHAHIYARISRADNKCVYCITKAFGFVFASHVTVG